MNKLDFIKEKLNMHYQTVVSKGYDVFATMLHGSQNYSMDEYSEDYMSDVDSKTIIIPSLNDIIFGKEYTSDVLVLEDNSHTDIKDIRKMFESFKKQNINYLEILYTPFYIVNPKYEKYFNELRTHRDDIVKISKKLFLKAACGTGENKYRHYLKPTPHSVEKIEKFGYDPKELHHLLRVKEFTERFAINDGHFGDCLQPLDIPKLMRIKKGQEYSLDEAIRQAEAAKEWFDKIKVDLDNDAIEPWSDEENQKGITFLHQLTEKVLVEKIKSELN